MGIDDKSLKMKYYEKTIYWRNPEKGYAFEAIGKVEITAKGLVIVYNPGVLSGEYA